MIYDWYKIFNLDTFNALDLISKKYTLNLEGLGQQEILVTKGNLVSLLYNGVFLSLNLNDVNPFEMDGYACYISDSNDVYLGIAVDET